jgi:hypothetical protein
MFPKFESDGIVMRPFPLDFGRTFDCARFSEKAREIQSREMKRILDSRI